MTDLTLNLPRESKESKESDRFILEKDNNNLEELLHNFSKTVEELLH